MNRFFVFKIILLMLLILLGFFIFKGKETGLSTKDVSKDLTKAVNLEKVSAQKSVIDKSDKKKHEVLSFPLSEAEESTLIKEYAKKFNFPSDVEEKLLAAASGKSVVAADVKDEEDSFSAARRVLGRVKKTSVGPEISNISSGFSVDTKKVSEVITVLLPQSLPAETVPQDQLSSDPTSLQQSSQDTLLPDTDSSFSQDNTAANNVAEQEKEQAVHGQEIGQGDVTASGQETDSEQTALLSSEALAGIGFWCLTEFDFGQAEKVFKTLLENYPDSEHSAMVSLELANIIFKQGRFNEALEMVDDAMYKYRDDQEYVDIARELKNEIESYE
ncbi:MAG: tetratricopeptide repeat protein [Candidatus Omnitrophota bacterium]